MGVAEGVADPAERQQAGVGVGAVGQIAEHDGQQLALDRRPAAHAGGECGEVPQRTLRVGVPEGLQPRPGGLRGQPDLVAGEPGHRPEQRSVEELLVQPGDDEAVRPPRLAQVVRGRAGPEHGAGEPPPGVVLGGQDVGAGQPVQLQAVLEHPEEAIGPVEVGTVVPTHVPVGGECLQRREGGSGADPRVGPAVDELEQLDRELDVAQAAAPQFELPVGLAGRDVVEHPAAHGAGGVHEAVALGGRPDERVDDGPPAAGEVRVPGGVAGLEHRLELPRSRPAPVVRLVAGQGADQGTVAALRAESGVDLPQMSLARGPAAHLLQADGHPGRDREIRRLVRPGLADRGLGLGLADVQDVDVTDVVELAGARLAEGDDGHADPVTARHLAPGDVEGRLEGAVGQVGQGAGHGVEQGGRVVGGEVVGHDAEQLTAVGALEGVVRGRPGAVRDGVQQRSATLQDREPEPRLEGREVLGVPDQVVRERPAAPEHLHQPVPPSGRQVGGPGTGGPGVRGPEVRGPVRGPGRPASQHRHHRTVARLDQAFDGQQRGVRVRGAGQRVDEAAGVDLVAESGQPGQRPVGVDETRPGDTRAHRRHRTDPRSRSPGPSRSRSHSVGRYRRSSNGVISLR